MSKYVIFNAIISKMRKIFRAFPIVPSYMPNANIQNLSLFIPSIALSYVIENLVDKWNDIQDKDHNNEVQSYYFMGAIIEDTILRYLLGDALKAGISFLLVFFYLRLMLGSWFLSSVGMFEIVMSLPLAQIFFRYVLQIKHFGSLNVLALFIVIF